MLRLGRITLLVALLALFSLIIVACGDDDDDAGEGESAVVTSTATEVSGEDIEETATPEPEPTQFPTAEATATEGSAADDAVQAAPAPAIEVPTEGRTKGDPDAPVTVVEYGDFQ